MGFEQFYFIFFSLPYLYVVVLVPNKMSLVQKYELYCLNLSWFECYLHLIAISLWGKNAFNCVAVQYMSLDYFTVSVLLYIYQGNFNFTQYGFTAPNSWNEMRVFTFFSRHLGGSAFFFPSLEHEVNSWFRFLLCVTYSLGSALIKWEISSWHFDRPVIINSSIGESSELVCSS